LSTPPPGNFEARSSIRRTLKPVPVLEQYEAVKREHPDAIVLFRLGDFYETFGDEIANDLVDWFNAVDATYRADLRELNELNFARFDAKLEQRLAELDTKWGSRWSQFDTKLEQLGSSLRVEIHAARADTVKWMFVFWAPTAIAVIDLLLRR